MQHQPRNDTNAQDGHYHPMEDDNYNFNFGPQDFDIDAEILSPNVEGDATFVLQPRENQPDARQKKKKHVPQSPSRDSRLFMLNMDTHQSNALPRLASPAAEGWGPTMAMPTLLGMGQAMEQDLEESTDLLDTSVFSARAQSIVEGTQHELQPPALPTTPASPTSPVVGVGPGKEMPPSIANIFPKLPRATVAGKAKQEERETSTPTAIPSREGEGPEDGRARVGSPSPLTSFQFPVDDDEEDSRPPPPPSIPPPGSKPRKATPPLSRKPLGPALKKSLSHSSTVSMFMIANHSGHTLYFKNNLSQQGKIAAHDKKPTFSEEYVFLVIFAILLP